MSPTSPDQPNINPDPQTQAPMDGVAPPEMKTVAPPVPETPMGQTAPVSPKPTGTPQAGRNIAMIIRMIFGLCYLGFIGWELFLLSFLPSPTGTMRELQSFGVLTSWVGAAVLLLVGWLAVMRVGQAKVSTSLRQRSLIMTVALLAPGVCLAVATPFFINREPTLFIDISNPTKLEDFVAPVSVTLSLERATATLKNLGYRAVKYQWDTNGDGKVDEETVAPVTTTIYQKQGVYTVTALVTIDGSSPRRYSRRVTIPRSVFAVTPIEPVVEKPVRFGLSELLTDPKQLKQATWDFGDGTNPVVSKTPDVTHTYYAVGDYEVSVRLLTQTNAEQVLKRTIAVVEPKPLPFPITLSVQPRNPIGPAPFGALFALNTKETLREVHWNFGDGKEERGADLLRTGHTFENVGIYPVIVRARSASGELAELTQIVRVSETLNISDLRFEGSPAVQNGKVKGELPLEVELTPKTNVPLVSFLWESDSDEVRIQESTLRATFRKEGTYTVTLVAQDADGKVFRSPVTIEVKPASAEPTIMARPENGVAPLTVQFDASESFIPPEETLAGFKWLFGDEQRSDDAELGPARVEHTYRTPGEYKVQLKLVTVSGKEFNASRTIVVRRPPLDACITTSRVRVQAGKGVEFDSDCSTGQPLTYVWDVRSDANPKVVLAQSPTAKYIYVFELPGTYTVSLSLRDEWNNQSTSTVSITVTP